VAALRLAHQVIEAAASRAPVQVDMTRRASLRALFERVGLIDAVVCTAGMVRFVRWSDATDDDWEHGLRQKLMGQVNLVRVGAGFVRDQGSFTFTLTSGVLAQHPMTGSSIVSTVNGAIEAFGRSAAAELGRGLSVSVVSPGWIAETLLAMGMDPGPGMPAAAVALRFKESEEGRLNGQTLVAARAA
jgi:NAD(P)-dependent dehydrogenase (short-subunit alcohol dehydrogenase family)